MTADAASRPTPSVTPAPRPGGHMPALDGLRGIAVLAVIAFHLARHAPAPGGAVSWWLAGLIGFGWAGVDLFFVLSGFLITGILYDNRRRGGYLRTFYGRRALRILPLYFAALAVIAVGWWIVGGTRGHHVLWSIPWHATFLTNVRVAVADTWWVAPQGTSHLWSLAVEEQFYLLWPLIVSIAALNRSIDPRKALMVVCAALVAASIVLRLALHGDHPHAAYVLFPARMDALAIGSFAALSVRGPLGFDAVRSAVRLVALMAAGAVIIAAMYSIGRGSSLHPVQQQVGYTLWATFFGAIVVRAASNAESRLGRALRTRSLVAIGRISFGLYVVHFPLMYALDAAGVDRYGFVAYAGALLGLSFGLAAASWRYLEQPMLQLKRHFNYGEASAGNPRPEPRRLEEQAMAA